MVHITQIKQKTIYSKDSSRTDIANYLNELNIKMVKISMINIKMIIQNILKVIKVQSTKLNKKSHFWESTSLILFKFSNVWISVTLTSYFISIAL